MQTLYLLRVNSMSIIKYLYIVLYNTIYIKYTVYK